MSTNNCQMGYPMMINAPITQGFYYDGFMAPYAYNCNYQGYYSRYLLQKVMSVFNFTFPEEWVFGLDDYFRYNLFISGNMPVLWDRKYGFICQFGAYEGLNIAMRPEYVVFNNQFLTNARRKINVDSVIFSLTPDYVGIYDKIYAYAELLAEMHVAIKTNIINSKNPIVYRVNDRKIADDMKLMYDKIQSGEPAVFTKDRGSQEEWGFFNPSTKSNYITPDMLIDMKKIINMFNTDFGIPNTNTDKRERLTDDEVNANNAETNVWCDMVLDRLKKCCDKVEEVFGTRYIDVDYSEAIKKGGNEDVSSNTDLFGNVARPSGNSQR